MGIGSLAAKLNIIVTFPQQAGSIWHSRVVEHLLLERSTMAVVLPNQENPLLHDERPEVVGGDVCHEPGR
jgi:hypothetical protein